MTSRSFNLQNRINVLNTVFTNEEQQQLVNTVLREANGDLSIALSNLEGQPAELLQKLTLTYSVADLAEDNEAVVRAISLNPDINNLRDMALNFNVADLAAIVDLETIPETIREETEDSEERKQKFAVALRRNLFKVEPTGVLQRMIEDEEVPIADTNVRAGVVKFLANQPEFNIRTTSIYTALQKESALQDIAEEQKAEVITELKTLQLAQAISPIPEAVSVLKNARLTSFSVTEMPLSTFIRNYGNTLGKEIAQQIYNIATNIRIRNEHALIVMRETIKGTGLNIIDRSQYSALNTDKPEVQNAQLYMAAEPVGKTLVDVDIPRLHKESIVLAQEYINQQAAVPLNLEELFGDMDYCECEECTSLYSPAAYFVELLQYLRNNNLEEGKVKDDPKDISDTPLEKLFRRRPDLGCLELTCENTFTVLPYVDLVNEVMESFVVHLDEYKDDRNNPKQAILETFNVEDETTSELLAQPQHTNYLAYCILKNAVYPFTLPYHQPIDAIRIFLNYLETSRHELQDTYRTAKITCENVSLKPEDEERLQQLHQEALDRAVDAEFLGLTQEEYIILTREAFWQKEYFEITLKKTFDYYKDIGGKQVHEYYGYEGQNAQDEMLSIEEAEDEQKGLTFVKKQFLPRTGIQYVDLVEILKTQFINPNFPQGRALSILESIRFSYQYLKDLMDDNSTTQQGRFAELLNFLENPETTQQLVPSLDNNNLHPDPCQQQKPNWCMDYSDLRNWIYCYFERIGKLIVLDSGEGFKLSGKLYGKKQKDPSLSQEREVDIGTLSKDGTIKDLQNKVIGYVKYSGKVVDEENKAPFFDTFKDQEIIEIFIKDEANQIIGGIDSSSFIFKYKGQQKITWLPAQDTCDLDKVRLVHLDGTPLKVEEYDRLHRFIRLWRKMGWTIDETDKALIGLDEHSADNETSPTSEEECDYVGFEVFKDDCSKISSDNNGDCKQSTDDFDCPDLVEITAEITPHFLHQLVAVKKLLDRTGLELAKLLTFWTKISINGEKSLYKRLFLTHNLLGIDKVFQADKHGNYLTESAKISEHLPVLMAALRLKADDINAIAEFRQLGDDLTLANVSILYRHSLLAKVLGIKVTELFAAIELFGNPFANANKTLEMLETWGKMEDAGFSFRQLNYIIRDRDDALRPIAPSQKTILQITKTLYDGLNKIEEDHELIAEENQEEATVDLVRAKATLLFEQSVVEQILGLLEGTKVYTTNAPANQTITVPKNLAAKIQYKNQADANPPQATLQVTGILTATEQKEAKALSSHPQWAKAFDRVAKQAENFFNDVLFGIFPDLEQAKSELLAGDVNLPTDAENAGAPVINTAVQKRFFFLQHFILFLRKQLSHRLIVETLSGVSSLPTDETDLLLTEVLTIGESEQSAISALQKIKETPAENPSSWQGYLIPTVDESYTFIAIGDTRPAPLMLDGQSISFPHQQEDPSNVWSSDPVKLKAGKLYDLGVSDRTAEQLEWKTATSPKAKIPASALLPDYSKQGAEEVFTKLYKAALLVNEFNLSSDEISYWQNNSADFDDFDFNQITLQHWKRLQAYTTLRNSLPRTETNLLDLFDWTKTAENPTELSAQISAATVWKQENIDKLIHEEHFDLNHLDAFCNEVNLVKLQKALTIADKIAVDIDKLFDWAKPTSKFWDCHQIAEDIRKAIRARFDQEDWEQVVKPLNDELRNHQKQALIDYLLVQPVLGEWGVVDADSLFEFFLIDVQMDTCMETSRIKQGISSIQLFIQRCLLGLEEQYGVRNGDLDRDRWEWMQRYRVWEANRKVFLYPENWIEPELRDDKSPFYLELESELLQKDIDRQTVQDAIKSYLFKVDEVANLKVVGLFLEQELDEDGNLLDFKLHIFARTRNAPYFFYYRYFHIKEGNWYPWEKVQVDIPSYDVENYEREITNNGTYLIPVVWNKRLLIFFPQFMKKTKAPETKDSVSVETGESGNLTIPTPKPTEFWEIKVGWSEYRNGKWTQKQLSAEAIYDSFEWIVEESTFEKINESLVNLYEFIPRIFSGDDSKVTIEVHRDRDEKAIGRFSFAGSQLSIFTGEDTSENNNTIEGKFHYQTNENETKIHSLQVTNQESPPFSNTEPYFQDKTTSGLIKIDEKSKELKFDHPFAHKLLGKLMTGNLDDLFNYYLTGIGEEKDIDDAYGEYSDTNSSGQKLYHELKKVNSLYNWEAAFHAPMLLVDSLLKAQQFEQALNMCHYVFNPMAEGNHEKRFWQFYPFRNVDAKSILEKLFLDLKPNESNEQINEWRDKPFQPHVIARSRPVAYMKWVVMKYIEILIAWGDYLFRQDTIETLNQATQLYILAAHIYGPRGQKIPKRGKVQPQTYKSLLDKWDAFGNAMVELELAFPFSNQTSLPIGVSNDRVGLDNIFGFATSLYFCIPDNPKLRGLRDTIDDRLFKIRHCLNIEGVFRKLPLFEPPIDPALLVQAAAKGLSLSSVLNDLNTPAPNYRFYYLLQKALELCSELKSLGNAFLSAKEKQDAEALSELRAIHESSIHNLVIEVRKQQLEEANKSLEALQQNRLSPVYRLQHYLQLIGEDLAAVPDNNTDFGELPNQIEKPIDESGLKLIGYEKEEMDKASAAADWQIGIGITETLASIFHVIPSVEAKGQPFGVGVGSVIFSGNNLGNAAQAVARGLQIYSNELSFKSTNAGRKGGFLRQLQDRVQQANIAGYEIKNIDKQILTQEIRINIAQQEFTNQQKQIENAKEVEGFIRNKYSNKELYIWMEKELKTLYYQAYTLAYDIAKKAEKVFRFERGLTTSNFIQFGYWDASRDGLLAGEKLYLGLKQLEAAYQEKRGHDYELTKSFSLRQINPLALLELKETGTCEFALPEVLFDMDFPGHYMRRIKFVALTVPCVVGPYTSLNCTLRLLEHKFRISAIAKDKNDYPEKIEETDDRFSTVNVPIQAIAVSTGQNDSGMFELNFQGERYFPFEGAGVISKWRIELPKEFRQFDYDTITDVVLQMRYTAVEGGDKLKKPAADSVVEYIKSVEELSREEGLFAAFDLTNEFASEWYKAMNPPKDATERVLTLNNLRDRLPMFTKGRDPKNIQATDIHLLTPSALTASKLGLKHNSEEQTFTDEIPINSMKSFVIKDVNFPITDWEISIQDIETEIDQLWLIVRYVLK